MQMNEINRLIGRTLRATQVAPASRKPALRAACEFLNFAREAARSGDDLLATFWTRSAWHAVRRARAV